MKTNKHFHSLSTLEEFMLVAERAAPSLSSLNGLKYSFNQWLCLNGTTLIERLGFNRKKILAIKKNLERQPIILNIGCFEEVDNNYINADLVPFGGIRSLWKFIRGKSEINYDLFVNISYHDPYLLEFADGIVLSHVLEHIHPLLVIDTLKNCFAYLKLKGTIRISVPNLKLYDQLNLPIIFPDCPEFPIHNRQLAKNKLIYDYGHQFMYDAELLTVLLKEASFEDVKEVSFRQGNLGETDPPRRQHESIYLTGIKTG